MKIRNYCQVLLLSAGLGCVVSLSAQAPSTRWSIGLSGGGDYNWHNINTHYQTDYHYAGAWGWNAAVFCQYDFFSWLGLRAEVEATERNHRFYRTSTFAGTDYTMHNTYIQVPVMTQFSFGGEKVRGFLNTGVYAGYWLSSKYDGTWYDDVSNTTAPLKQDYVFNKNKDRRANFGLAGGIGILYIPAEHWGISWEGRCYYDMLSTVKQYMQVKDYRYNTTLHFMMGVSYRF